MVEALSKQAAAQYSLDDNGKIAVTYPVSSVIVVTEDRIRWRLMKHLQDVGARGAWLAPAGILLSLMLTLSTSSFKDALGVLASTWNAFFLLSIIPAGGWLIVALIRSTRAEVGVEDLIDLLKSDTAEAKVAGASQSDGHPDP